MMCTVVMYQRLTDLYRRLAENGLFATTLTNVLPNNKSGAVLHPNVRLNQLHLGRVLTTAT